MNRDRSRREFLKGSAAAGGALLFGQAWLRGAQNADPRVAAILSRTLGIDMHNHVYPAGTEPHPQGGGRGGSAQGGPGGRGPAGERQDQQQAPELFIAEELKQSGLTAVCASYVLDFAPIVKPGDAREKLLNWFGAIDAQLEKGHIRRALNLKDLQAAHDTARPTIIQTVEGAMFIEGRPERVEEVYKRGLRHLQLLHEHDDIVAPLGDTNTAAAHLGGLTPVGAQVVRECNRLGIVVDLAHASNETVLGALKVATQPVIVSHTNLDTWTGRDARMAQMMKPRLISREHAKVVADAGGVVGVWTHLTGSLEEFVESIKAMADAIGVDHTGIGTDTDLLSSRAGQGTTRAYPDMPGGFFPAVVTEMLRQGFGPEEIMKIGGGNYCRIFGKVTSGHA